MKPQMRNWGLISLVIFAASILSGCAAPGVANDPTGSVSEVRALKRFQVVETFRGYGMTGVKGDKSVMGVVALDPDQRTLFWNNEPAVLLDSLNPLFPDGRYFYLPKRSAKLFICRDAADRRACSVTVWDGAADVRLQVTTTGLTSQDLLKFLPIFTPDPDTEDLWATFKVIDGDAVNLPKILHAGKITFKGGNVLLDGSRCKVGAFISSDGKGYFSLRTGSRVMVIWPSGGWCLYDEIDNGLRIAGIGLESMYMRIRSTRANEQSMPPPNVPDAVKRRLKVT